MIELPVSLGEAIDKLTILEIKLEKINDNRHKEVQVEHSLLLEKLKTFIKKYHKLYESMKKVNLIIWDDMNALRDGEIIDDVLYGVLCRKVITYNDIRFRLKNKINMLSESVIKEQKGYKINKIVVRSKNVKEITYLSFLYDQVIVVGDKIAGVEDDDIAFVDYWDDSQISVCNIDENTISRLIS